MESPGQAGLRAGRGPAGAEGPQGAPGAQDPRDSARAPSAGDFGYRLASRNAAPTTDANYLTLDCEKGARLPLSLSQLFHGLPAGTYTVGLAVKTTSKQWNANDAGRVLVFTTK
mgnify:CR=1 FL=1